MLTTCYSILPFIKNYVSDTAFAVAFITEVTKAGKRCDTIRPEVVQNVFRDIFSDLIPEFKLAVSEPAAKRPKLVYGSTRPEALPHSDADSSGSGIATLIQQSSSIELEAEVKLVMKTVKTQAIKVDISAFEAILFPMLKRLLTSPEVQKGSLAYHDFFYSILDTCTQRYVSKGPKGPRTQERGNGSLWAVASIIVTSSTSSWKILTLKSFDFLLIRENVRISIRC